jgi:hypothetical protein
MNKFTFSTHLYSLVFSQLEVSSALPPGKAVPTFNKLINTPGRRLGEWM